MFFFEIVGVFELNKAIKAHLFSENLAHCWHIRGTLPLKKGFFVEKCARNVPELCKETI